MKDFIIPDRDFGTPASKSKQMVTLTIDGFDVTVPEGTSIMRAAAELGISVPKLCATDSVDAFGSCRLCLVEIEGRNGTPASCTTPVAPGLKVKTQNAKLKQLRRGVMELYISDHPLDCLTCATNGDCELQDMAGAVGLRDVWGFSATDQELARICQRAENIAVGAPTGIMDQTVSLMAKDGHALFLDCRSLEIDAIPFDLQSDGLAIVVMDTQVKHSHANGGYSARRASCEKAAEALDVDALRDATIEQLEAKRGEMDGETYRRARHIITENDRVLNTVSVLKTDGPRAIGNLLVASHVSMRDDFEISCPELDLAVDTALSAGAVGARMTGGGFGGAAIALVESAHAENLIARVEAAFADAGYHAPVCFSVIASEGAKRESL